MRRLSLAASTSQLRAVVIDTPRRLHSRFKKSIFSFLSRKDVGRRPDESLLIKNYGQFTPGHFKGLAASPSVAQSCAKEKFDE